MKRGTLIYGESNITQAVQELYPLFEQCQVMTFTGTLGAGKTTLVQALLKKAGVKGPLQSPTFAYVNEYKDASQRDIYHFDLYRLNSLDEFLSSGFDEYLSKGSHAKVLIEWPEIVMSLLQKNVCHVCLDYEGIYKRRLTYVYYE